MQAVYQLIRNLIFYVFLVSIIINLVGEEKYKKYIRFFVGVILVFILVTPIRTLFGGENVLEAMQDQFDYFLEKNYVKIDFEETKNKFMQAEEGQNQKLFEQYQAMIKNQLEKLVKKYDYRMKKVQLKCSDDEEEYGKLTSVTLWIEKQSQEKGEEIEKVQISSNWKEREEEKIKQETLVEKIKNEIESQYGIEKNAIKIYE